MSSTTVSSTNQSATASVKTADANLEVIVIPVSDVDRAKEFYRRLGWRLDADVAPHDDFRLIQFTPPGSKCSIQFGTNLTSATPGSAQGLYLIVSDIDDARNHLIASGVEISEVFHEGTPGARFHTTDARISGPAPAHGSYRSFASFSDPDGNGWLLQEVTTRLPGRVDSTTTSFASATDLASAMGRASVTHGQHEKRTGEADPNWPDWYPSTCWPTRPARNRRCERLNRERLGERRSQSMS
jgi:catechol 2,3-dioxygenase-like lactoylglutathione lyase family enzyme